MSDIENWDILAEVDEKLTSKVKFVCIFGNDSDEVLIVTKSDEVYGFGINRDGCLGLGHKKPVEEPKLVSELSGKEVINIAYGYSHVIAITKSGECYSWGDNACGQLGSNSKNNIYEPELIKDMSGKGVIDMSCGSFHTLFLTQTGVVFGFGLNAWGQVGCNNTKNQLKPIIINGFNDAKVTAISCGNHHSMALTESGIVYSWGNNRKGQLGVGDSVDRIVPHKVDMNRGLARQICCGQFHSLYLSLDDYIYAFGHNDCGQIGCGTFMSQYFPVRVKTSDKFNEIASEFKSDISIAKSKNGFCYVWGKCHKLVSIPMETEIELIHDVFASYAKRKITYRPMQLKVRPASSPIIGNLKRAFNNPEFSDLTLQFSNNLIYVNMSYLKIRCQTLFSGIFTKFETQVILNSYEVWFAFIKYLYTDCVQTEVENAVELYFLADMSSEEGLKLKCFEIIKGGIDVNNVFTLYSSAIKYGIKELDDICSQFAVNNMTEAIMTDAFEALDPLLCKQFMRNAAKLGFFDSE